MLHSLHWSYRTVHEVEQSMTKEAADCTVGFPGETAKQFLGAISLIEVACCQLMWHCVSFILDDISLNNWPKRNSVWWIQLPIHRASTPLPLTGIDDQISWELRQDRLQKTIMLKCVSYMHSALCRQNAIFLLELALWMFLSQLNVRLSIHKWYCLSG